MKYSQEQLQAMAKEALEAKDRGDVSYMMFLVKLAVATGLTPDEVEKKIKEFV